MTEQKRIPDDVAAEILDMRARLRADPAFEKTQEYKDWAIRRHDYILDPEYREHGDELLKEKDHE